MTFFWREKRKGGALNSQILGQTYQLHLQNLLSTSVAHGIRVSAYREVGWMDNSGVLREGLDGIVS